MREAEILKEGGVGVLATDTLYGLVAAAQNKEAVERVYALKTRTPSKPCIILIASINQLADFDIKLSQKQKEVMATFWPGPVSIIFLCGPEVPEYLHRGTHTLAFRLPQNTELQKFLAESGPLIVPSANPEGKPPATTTEEAKKYFGNSVDFYINSGTRVGEPSTVIELHADGATKIIRKGR